MPPYEIQSRCTVADAAQVADNNVSAFWQQTWWRILFGAPMESVVAAVALRSPQNLINEREVRRHQAVVDKATGDIVGYARWILPPEHAAAWTEAQTPDVGEADRKRFKDQFDEARLPKCDNKEEMDALDVPVEEAKHRLTPKEPFMKLDYLATRPGHQKRGISSMLVKLGIEQADKLGIKVFVLAKGHAATNLYKKHGFELQWDLSQSLKKFGHDDDCYTAIMIRQPIKE